MPFAYINKGKELARKARVFLEDTPNHVKIEAIDNLALFKDKEDLDFFYDCALSLSRFHLLAIHSYAIVPTFFEFVATATNADSLPKFMQSLARRYTEYYNKKYDRKGTLWQGRYKSSLVEINLYLLKIMHYIENYVAPSKKYLLNSINKNLYGQKDELVVPHKLYKNLGYTDDERTSNYKQWCESHPIDQTTKQFISTSLYKQTLTGSSHFAKELESLIGITLTPKKRGRPKTKIQRKKMYKNLVLLDKKKHKDLKLKPLQNINFAKEVKFVPTVAAEVGLISQMLPVVFSADKEPKLVTLTSLGSESLAIDANGKWIGSYVPLHFRKYPFASATPKEDSSQRVMLLDEEAPVFSTTEGEPLFNEDGTQSPMLKKITEFLANATNEETVTKNVINEIMKTDILEDREIAVGEGESKKVLVAGFKVVNKEKLNALSDDILASWARKGIISMIDYHISSLSKVQTLFNLASKNQG